MVCEVENVIGIEHSVEIKYAYMLIKDDNYDMELE